MRPTARIYAFDLSAVGNGGINWNLRSLDAYCASTASTESPAIFINIISTVLWNPACCCVMVLLPRSATRSWHEACTSAVPAYEYTWRMAGKCTDVHGKRSILRLLGRHRIKKYHTHKDLNRLFLVRPPRLPLWCSRLRKVGGILACDPFEETSLGSQSYVATVTESSPLSPSPARMAFTLLAVTDPRLKVCKEKTTYIKEVRMMDVAASNAFFCFLVY